ncbi:hypothetical protein BDD12DRAFT_333858 [Trichophaea hybrida]|nr:hypothetical protein BDD12DRAFT_333858 [Trichophaea hybrida]
MVTGVEAAGLALAIFPLVVNGLGCYLDGIRKIKQAKNYRGVLKRLIRNFEMEKIKFQNTCEFFLGGMVSAKEMEDLVSGVGWNRPEFQCVLLGRLRENAADAFIAAVEALTESLQELGKDLGFDEDQKVRFCGLKSMDINSATYSFYCKTRGYNEHNGRSLSSFWTRKATKNRSKKLGV